MCVSCMSSAEAIAITAIGGIGAGRATLRRTWHVVTGRGTDRATRTAAVDAANAEFLRALDLDPDEVLPAR